MSVRSRVALAATLICFAAIPPLASGSGVAYPDGDWSEAWIQSPSSAGEATLHADVLRPKGYTDADKTPVILSIGPYFNHSGQTGPAGPAEDTQYDPVGPNEGPSERFQDFVEGSGLLKNGYSFVMVDLRGFGGSNGCLDWSGPGEQADVVNAVKWAASQPWSTGKVGMYGKSYDGLTGLIGVDKRPAGLAAVVSQEPVYDDYRYLYGDGIRRENSLATPALYDGIAATPGPLTDDPNYNAKSLNDPVCLGQNWAAQAGDDNHDTDFWKQRNLIPGAKGSDVPLFLTQGLTENNTVADGLAQYMQNHTGYERAWLGPWKHVRGNERCSQGGLLGDSNCNADNEGTLKMGRAGWFDEVMRFYDRFLKGSKSRVRDPMIAVQTNDGKWRGEEVWPPKDSTGYTSELLPGTYTDDGDDSLSATDPAGVWTISPPVPYDAHLSGSGHVDVDVSTTLPRANLVVDVYDLDPSGTGPLITRQAHMIRETGDSTIPLDLWSADWKIPAGHRIGVKVADINSDFWLFAAPTFQDVTVDGGTITLPFLGRERTDTIQGDPGVQLESYLSETVTVPRETMETSESDSFVLPPRQKGDRDSGIVAAGPAQAPIEGSVTTKAPGVGVVREDGVTSEFFEFDVAAGYDNAVMRGQVTPTLPADLDLYLERQADDGSWVAAGDGANGGDLGGESISKASPTPGHYRLEVHNWAGGPNQVGIELTFLNSAGQPGT
jgi:putative CocE/NonD family hydrolase